FSSRRRHTRFSRDWSSDVCSSDLWQGYAQVSARDGVLTTLRQHFAQLRFPVAAGIQHTPAYRVATGMGMHAAPAGDDTLELERPEALQLGVHQDLLGRAPVLSTPHRPATTPLNWNCRRRCN